MNSTFYLTNVVPQNYENNAGYWNRFEIFCRDLTQSFSDVRVFTGPLFLPNVVEGQKKYVKYEVRVYCQLLSFLTIELAAFLDQYILLYKWKYLLHLLVSRLKDAFSRCSSQVTVVLPHSVQRDQGLSTRGSFHSQDICLTGFSLICCMYMYILSRSHFEGKSVH